MAWAQDEFGATALRLGGSFGEQAEAVEKLGLSGDPRALPLLQALADGKLTRMPDGALRIGEADALTGAPANAAGTSAVRINNRVRAALRIALGRLQIVSPDPAERLRAADGILRSRSAQDLPLLDAALARESVPRIRDRLVLAQGAAMERGLIRHLYGRPLETLLMTFGVGMMLQQAVRLIFGAQNREVSSPSWMQGTLMLPGEISVTQNRLWIIVFGIAVLLLVMAAIRFTRFGLDMRAVVQNRRIAATMGIRTGRVDALTFAFGSGIAGMAGVALSQIDNVSPNLGTGYIVDSFMVVVFGGVGSLAGTLIGALTLGVVNKLLEPYAGVVLAKVAVLVGIMLFIQRRPKGLFALKGRAADQ